MIKNFKQHLAKVPDLIKKTSPNKFYSLLIGLFLLPGGSFICLFALYLRFIKKAPLGKSSEALSNSDEIKKMK